MTKTDELSLIQSEVDLALANKANQTMLLATTFKGVTPENVRQALIEGRLRGFSFRDFLEKNVYAVPFQNRQTGRQEYSLVTSVDYARKIGMRSGVVGKSAPIYEEQDGKLISCTITVKRKINDYVGDFTATVYFSEYNTNRNLWTSKPRTMLAKVAEMHALRMACPEELAQSFIEEEYEKDVIDVVAKNMDDYKAKVEGAADLDELKRIWSALPIEAKEALEAVKDEVKGKLSPKQAEPVTNEPEQADEATESEDTTAQDVADAFGGHVVEDEEESLAAKKMRAGMNKSKTV